MIVLLVFIGGVMGGMIRLLCARSLPPLWGYVHREYDCLRVTRLGLFP